MKSLYLIVSIVLFLGFSLKAEDKVYERAYVHTDKDCYIAGEDILLKFYVVNSDFQPSNLSKVGYVEICDTEKPWIQLSVALEKGGGAGKITIPGNIPTGNYRLSGYTRYMRNEGKNVFFNKLIAIVNVAQQIPDSKRFEPVEKPDDIPLMNQEQTNEKETAGLLIKTDQDRYGNRKKVILSLDNISGNAADLVISVSRDDSIAKVPEIDDGKWLKQVTDTFPFSLQWLPEYEGQIISGRFVPEPKESLHSNIAFVGNDIRYFNGKQNSLNGTTEFYTSGIFGKQQIVTSVVSLVYGKVPYRIDLISPFCELLPDSLPVLQIYPNEKRLLERYVGVQIKEKAENDSLNLPVQLLGYCTFQPVKTYDLDQYTRFGTISETILEFITRLRVTKVNGKRTISAYLDEENQFSVRTLVLLDGVPIYNHEDILGYNPINIKLINIYDGRYTFCGENFEGIVSFVTRKSDLPFFQLSDGSQLFNYNCPQLPPSFESPDYSTGEAKNFRKPDFRHTLYWNPSVKSATGQPVNFSFYTSDLCGEFKVTVEGITTDGKVIHATSHFQVIAAK